MGAVRRLRVGRDQSGDRVRHPARLPVAFVLMLFVAGCTVPPPRPVPGDQIRDVAAPTQASVTLISPQRFPDGPPTLPPAIRIAASGDGHAFTQVAVAGILLNAYRKAVAGAPASCHLPVSLLAAIGQVESGSLAGRTIDSKHRAAILGPVLNGTNGFRAIADTDNGKWDGNKVWDRAVGPLQFLPSTWRTFGVDGNGDGVADPQNIEDAAATAAAYLCYGGRNLSKPAQLRSAILAYNASSAYEQLVLTYQKRFASFGLDGGATVVGLSLGAAGAPVAGKALPGVYTDPTGAPTTGPKVRLGGTEHKSRTSTSRTTRAAASPTGSPSKAGGGGTGNGPSSSPADHPTTQPSKNPSKSPSSQPSSSPGGDPSPSGDPSGDPTTCPPTPSATPATDPSPTAGATGDPTCPPCGTTDSPSGEPTATASPTADPTADPGTCPTPVTDPSSTASP